MPYRAIKTIDGHRGSFLVLAGLLFLPVSVSYVFLETSTRVEVLSWMPDAIRLWHLGLVFTAASLFGTVVGLLSKRLPPRVVGFGYMAVMIPPAFATVIFAVAALLGISTTAWLTVSTYGVIAAMIYLVSAWPNPTPPPTAPTTIPGKGVV